VAVMSICYHYEHDPSIYIHDLEIQSPPHSIGGGWDCHGQW